MLSQWCEVALKDAAHRDPPPEALRHLHSLCIGSTYRVVSFRERKVGARLTYVRDIGVDFECACPCHSRATDWREDINFDTSKIA